jgi:integrase
VSDLYEDWLTDIEAEGRTLFYIKQTRQRFRDYLLPVFGHLKASAIKTKAIAEFKRDLLRSGRAPKTVKNILGVLSAFLNHLAASGDLEAVPRFPKMKVTATNEKRWLDRVSQAKIIEAADPEDRLLFRTLIETGERVSEACAHQVRDLMDGGIRIVRSFDEYGELKSTKTGRDDLRPISRALYEELFLSCGASDPAQFLFIRDGKPYTRRKLRYRWQMACKAAGVPSIPPSQASRHSRASQLRRELEQETAERLRDALGHESAQTTMAHYALEDNKRLESK